MAALLWSLPGGVTSSGATVAVHTDSAASVVVEHDTDPGFGSVTAESAVNAESANGFTAKIPITGLSADTQHYYRIKLDGGAAESDTGAFLTAPTPASAHSFTFAFGSCAFTSSTHAVFAAIAAQSPDFFVHLGDLHYEDIATDDVALFRAAYENSVGVAAQNALYRGRGFVYTIDDHDFSGNVSDAGSTSRPAVLKAYREQMPSYPLQEGDPEAWDGPIYQKFTWGRVRFLLLDVRSERDRWTDTDDASKTMLGAEQLQWLKDEISAAALVDEAVCLITSVAWVQPAAASDAWGGYSTERREIADHIQSEGMNRRIFILSGDQHSMAFDDGSHTNHATTPSGHGPPEFCSSPMQQSGGATSVWSGSQLREAVSGSGHYATISVRDDGGDSIYIEFNGYYVTGGGTETLWNTSIQRMEVAPETIEPVGDAHRFWRVRAASVDGSLTRTSINVLEMYESALGPNVCEDGRSFASSVASNLGIWRTPYAFDGDVPLTGEFSQVWAAAFSADQWLAYDFGAGNDKEIVAVGIWSRINDPDQSPKTFALEYSDNGTDWFEKFTVTDSSDWGSLEYRRFVHPAHEPSFAPYPYGTHEYWRLVGIPENDDSVAHGEIEMRATLGGADQCTGGTATASSNFSGSFNAPKAFDDNLSTLWTTSVSQEGAWIQYQFPGPVGVAQVLARSRHDSLPEQSYTNFGVQYSDDGELWTTIWWHGDETGWTIGEERLFADSEAYTAGTAESGNGNGGASGFRKLRMSAMELRSLALRPLSLTKMAQADE